MDAKINQQILRCPSRKRAVEVSYTKIGPWWSPRYEIVACPAMSDGATSCERSCRALLGRPANDLFGMAGVPHRL